MSRARYGKAGIIVQIYVNSTGKSRSHGTGDRSQKKPSSNSPEGAEDISPGRKPGEQAANKYLSPEGATEAQDV
jgi:hypothetical protein